MNSFSASAPVAMGATPGGPQDISYFRDRVKAGELPGSIPGIEGLLREHDLPVDSDFPCDSLLYVDARAMAVTTGPEPRYLAQIGFSSDIDAGTFRRAPLHLVAVIDRSDAMSGKPLKLAKESLLTAVSQMNPDDELSIVLSSDRPRVDLNPTPVRDRAAIEAQIQRIESGGASTLAEGLAVGFELARTHEFTGTARVMLFSNVQPGVSDTDARSVMRMATEAANAGVGMTMIVVSAQFDESLASALSSVRGGNAFFFPDIRDVEARFKDAFDTMVTELAYDVNLTIVPIHGLRIPIVLGIPGPTIRPLPSGGISAVIDTIFLSRKKGAIYASLECDSGPGQPAVRPAIGASVANITLNYQPRGGADRCKAHVDVRLVEAKSASVGLARGHVLTDQWLTISDALHRYYGWDDREEAYREIHALASTYRQAADCDPDLAEAYTTLFALEQTLAKSAGHPTT